MAFGYKASKKVAIYVSSPYMISKSSLIGILASILFIQMGLAQENTMVCIAGYKNDDFHNQKEGKFIADILNSAKIEWVAVGSAGMSVDVNSTDADRARYLLAKALIGKPMDIGLSVKSDTENRYLEISPKDVINKYEAKQAEQDAAANP